jgi:hypothetical protein
LSLVLKVLCDKKESRKDREHDHDLSFPIHFPLNKTKKGIKLKHLSKFEFSIYDKNMKEKETKEVFLGNP